VTQHSIHIFINRKKYDLTNPVQTGRALKELAGIALTDVLFLQRPGDDEVVGDDTPVTLKNGDHLHSQPPANYGDEPRYADVQRLPQPDGWTYHIYNGYRLPPEYRPDVIRLLVKLPPTFPDAQPDMFWVSPAVCIAATGAAPAGASIETVLGESWQRFSWHLVQGAWRAGASDLRDYLRCILGRFERRN
jgi:hypothetical protein